MENTVEQPVGAHMTSHEMVNNLQPTGGVMQLVAYGAMDCSALWHRKCLCTRCEENRKPENVAKFYENLARSAVIIREQDEQREKQRKAGWCSIM